MRIGLVIYDTLETVSGGYLYDRKLVAHLRRAGDSVEVISIPSRNYASHLTDNFSSDLFHRLRDARIDILLQDELNHPSLFDINRRLRAVKKFPIVSIVHHLRCYEAHAAWQKNFYRWVERRYLASVDGFIFNSQTTRRAVSAILGRAPANFVVAHPAGDRFQPAIDATMITARARQIGSLRIVFVGNLIPRKGLHTLLDALSKLPGQSWQLTIVGNPNVDAKYTRAIRQQINAHQLTQARLVGALQDNALANVLAQSHVLIVPSEYEGYGIVYLEAMSFGLPAIATTAGAANEIIADGVNGFLVEPNNAVTLAERIAVLQNDRAQLARMGLAARERFLAHPRWDESMAQIRTKLLEMMQ